MTSKFFFNALLIVLGVLELAVFILILIFDEKPLIFHANMLTEPYGEVVTSYKPDDTFWLSVSWNKLQTTGHVLETKWYLVSAKDYYPAELQTLSVTLKEPMEQYFDLSNNGEPWPIGKYKVEVYFDGTLIETVNFSVTGENLQDKEPLEIHARMVSDIDGPTVSYYAPEDHFYLVADLNKAQAGHVLEVKWHLVSVEGHEPGELSTQSATLENYKSQSFETLNTAGSWPVGEYKAEVYFDGAFVEIVNFSVK